MTERHDDFDARHRLAMEELAASRIPAAQHDPPVHRTLRRLGVKLRPPHYQAQSVNVAMFGAPFAVFIGVAMWLVPGLMDDASGAAVVLMAALGGAIFGWLMARSWRRDAEAARLTDWEDLSRDGNRA